MMNSGSFRTSVRVLPDSSPSSLPLRLARWCAVLVLFLALVDELTVPAVAADAAASYQTATPIKHFVALMQENHSFDNYFGTYPGVNGIPANVCMPVDTTGGDSSECVKPFHIGNRAISDLDHTYQVHVAQYDGGNMDGFVSAFTNLGKDGTLAMGYYDDRDLPFYWNVADDYVLFDQFFTSAAGGSVRNHNYWVMGQAGVTDPRVDSIPKEGWGDLPTIFDRLDQAGISWKFYIQNYDPTTTYRNRGNGDRAAQVVWCPLLNFARFLDNPSLNSGIVDLNQYFVDLQNDQLPAVSFIVPSGASEHPPGSILAGQRFVKKLLNALMQSRAWDSSAFMWTYDDWGGWYDHVKPPSVDAFGYGFRAPALLVSAYAKQGYIDDTVLDFTSMLKFVEANWGVEPLAARDSAANNFLEAFDFNQPPRAARIIPSVRATAAPPGPRRSMIYLSYFAALAISGMVIGTAFARPTIPEPVRRRVAGSLTRRSDLKWTLVPWHVRADPSAYPDNRQMKIPIDIGRGFGTSSRGVGLADPRPTPERRDGHPPRVMASRRQLGPSNTRRHWRSIQRGPNAASPEKRARSARRSPRTGPTVISRKRGLSVRRPRSSGRRPRATPR